MKDKDGLEKNLDKLAHEAELVTEGMKPHFKRWLRRPWDTHAAVNLFVEARRISPYLLGHVDAAMYSILVALLIWNLV